MSTEGHPLDLLLREATGSPQPSETEYLRGRRMLNAAIAAETHRVSGLSRVGSWLPRVAAVGASFVLVVAIGIGISLMRPQPVTALGELAQVAESIERSAAADGEYLYSRTTSLQLSVLSGADLGLPEYDEIAYQIPTTSETWVADGVRRESRATLQPVFFNPEVERAYFDAGLDARDNVGITTDMTYSQPVQIIDERDWPTTPGQLRQAMEAYTSNEGSAVGTDVRIVQLAAELLRESGASPELRATTIRVLEDIGVDVTERAAGRGVSVGLEYVDGVRRMLVLEFDADANLVREYEKVLDGLPALGIPAGTIVNDATYSPIRIVTDLPE